MSHANKPPANTTLRDFADLKRALTSAAKEAAAKAAQEKAERAKREATQRSQEADSAMFKKAVGQVNALPSTGRITHQAAKPKPVPASRQLDEKAVLQESLSDEFDVESLLETDESLSWRRPELGVDVVRKLRRGVWALQAELDLHGLRTDEAREQTSSFLREAQMPALRAHHPWQGAGLTRAPTCTQRQGQTLAGAKRPRAGLCSGTGRRRRRGRADRAPSTWEIRSAVLQLRASPRMRAWLDS